jgi:predicted nuclease of restriction endonuclease-like (RecB) superfamily
MGENITKIYFTQSVKETEQDKIIKKSWSIEFIKMKRYIEKNIKNNLPSLIF